MNSWGAYFFFKKIVYLTIKDFNWFLMVFIFYRTTIKSLLLVFGKIVADENNNNNIAIYFFFFRTFVLIQKYQKIKAKRIPPALPNSLAVLQKRVPSKTKLCTTSCITMYNFEESYVYYFITMNIFSDVPDRDAGGWYVFHCYRATAPNRGCKEICFKNFITMNIISDVPDRDTSRLFCLLFLPGFRPWSGLQGKCFKILLKWIFPRLDLVLCKGLCFPNVPAGTTAR